MFFLKTCYRSKVFDILIQQNIYVSYKAFAAINLFSAFQLIKKKETIVAQCLCLKKRLCADFAQV